VNGAEAPMDAFANSTGIYYQKTRAQTIKRFDFGHATILVEKFLVVLRFITQHRYEPIIGPKLPDFNICAMVFRTAATVTQHAQAQL
jgi:hypothetical protein